MQQDYINQIDETDWESVSESIASKSDTDVRIALNKERLDIEDFKALISPAAAPYLEQMAAKSRQLTLRRFGKTIQFYIPLYLTNACTNHCVYCGFNHENKIKRIILTDEEILNEVRAIKELGQFEHILLVTGESPRHAGVEYLENAIRLIKPYFSSISIEVQPMEQEDYERLIQAGLNSVYIYQETYNQERYPIYHPKGKKRDFKYRLDTYDRLGKAGIHRMGLGVLIGLEDWKTDVTMMAMHLRYLQKRYWRTKFSISFPRMRPHTGEGFKPNVIMKDRELAQLMFAFRLFDHDVELALSTRELPEFRNNMIQLGVTSMSAGSKTEPGGYFSYPNALEQFEMADNRHPEEIRRSVQASGYEVIWKDWDHVLD
ncbi:MAG: 2-iminoacetate synthase ThiH [Bacteroidales bacterium]